MTSISQLPVKRPCPSRTTGKEPEDARATGTYVVRADLLAGELVVDDHYDD